MATTKKTFPIAFKTCKIADIKEWCIANDKMDWLREVAKEKPHFFVVRNKFFRTFAPDCIPVAEPKKKPWWELD